MPPKRKPFDNEFHCTEVRGAQNFQPQSFQAQTDEVFKYNWSEVFCFPYVLCTRFWDCCVSICAGTNQCVVYWMMIQWLVCKITHLTTPDPILFPYYFYVFCQVILLTSFFILLWVWFGKTIIIPYFYAFYEAFVEDITEVPPKNASRLSLRKYCFRKSEIFDTPPNNVVAFLPNEPLNLAMMCIQVFVQKVLQ